MGLSTSGKAASVILAFEKARELGMTTVAMTGSAASPASALADHWIAVPSTDTPRIQESHITIGHLWAELIEAAPGTVAGTNDPDPTDADPVPTPFDAATVHEYVFPFDNPDTMIGLDTPAAEPAAPPSDDTHDTKKPVIALPPVAVGAVHDRATLPVFGGISGSSSTMFMFFWSQK